MRSVALGLALSVISSAAAPGPWLRDEGSVFLSFGQNLALSDGAELPVHLDPNLYAEWGATDRLTLAFSAFSGDAGREDTIEIRGITQIPLPETGGHNLTLSFGIGARRIDGEAEVEPLVLAGLAWGRSLESGWLTAEAQITLRPEASTAEGKIDVTWGHHFDERWSGFVLLTAGEGHAGDAYAKITPSGVYRLSDRASVALGITQGLTGDKGSGLTFSTWIEF